MVTLSLVTVMDGWQLFYAVAFDGKVPTNARYFRTERSARMYVADLIIDYGKRYQWLG